MREVWLIEVHILGTDQEPWLLLTDWPITDEQSAARIFTMYRQRWGVEDSFKFLKTCLGWYAGPGPGLAGSANPGGFSMDCCWLLV